MPDPAGRVRRGMDVFTLDGVYLGSVLRISRDVPSSDDSQMLLVQWMVPRRWSTVLPSLRRLPLGLVQAVSLERVVLSATADALQRSGQT